MIVGGFIGKHEKQEEMNGVRQERKYISQTVNTGWLWEWFLDNLHQHSTLKHQQTLEIDNRFRSRAHKNSETSLSVFASAYICAWLFGLLQGGWCR